MLVVEVEVEVEVAARRGGRKKRPFPVHPRANPTCQPFCQDS